MRGRACSSSTDRAGGHRPDAHEGENGRQRRAIPRKGQDVLPYQRWIGAQRNTEDLVGGEFLPGQIPPVPSRRLDLEAVEVNEVADELRLLGQADGDVEKGQKADDPATDGLRQARPHPPSFLVPCASAHGQVDNGWHDEDSEQQVGCRAETERGTEEAEDPFAAALHPPGCEIEDQRHEGELDGVDLGDGGVDPEDEPEGACPSGRQGRRPAAGRVADGQSQEERCEGAEEDRGQDHARIRTVEGKPGEEVGGAEVERVAGWVVDAQGTGGDNHFGAVDGVQGVQRPVPGHRCPVHGEGDDESQGRHHGLPEGGTHTSGAIGRFCVFQIGGHDGLVPMEACSLRGRGDRPRWGSPALSLRSV